MHAFDMDPYEPLIPPSDTMEQEVILEEEIVLALSALHPMLAGLSIETDGEGWPCIDLADLAGAAFILPSTSVRLLDIAHLLCSGVAGEHTVRVSDKGFDALLGQLQYQQQRGLSAQHGHPAFAPRPSGCAFSASGAKRCAGRWWHPPQGHRAEHPARQFIRIAREAMAAPSSRRASAECRRPPQKGPRGSGRFSALPGPLYRFSLDFSSVLFMMGYSRVLAYLHEPNKTVETDRLPAVCLRTGPPKGVDRRSSVLFVFYFRRGEIGEQRLPGHRAQKFQRRGAAPQTTSACECQALHFMFRNI